MGRVTSLRLYSAYGAVWSLDGLAVTTVRRTKRMNWFWECSLGESSLNAVAARVMLTKAAFRYLELTTLLQKTYNLEPAGSHGVWGLDDYCFLPYVSYIFTPPQILTNAYIKLSLRLSSTSRLKSHSFGLTVTGSLLSSICHLASFRSHDRPLYTLPPPSLTFQVWRLLLRALSITVFLVSNAQLGKAAWRFEEDVFRRGGWQEGCGARYLGRGMVLGWGCAGCRRERW